MGYIKAEDLLPPELLRRVQEYAEGQLLYIPRRDAHRNAWGSLSGAQTHLRERNARIRDESRAGAPSASWRSATTFPKRASSASFGTAHPPRHPRNGLRRVPHEPGKQATVL